MHALHDLQHRIDDLTKGIQQRNEAVERLQADIRQLRMNYRAIQDENSRLQSENAILNKNFLEAMSTIGARVARIRTLQRELRKRRKSDEFLTAARSRSNVESLGFLD